MYNGLLHAHSGLRWIVVVLLIIAIIKSFSGWKGKKQFDKSDNMLGAMLMGFTHLQFIMGLVMYFVSPKVVGMGEAMKDGLLRFWALEHGLMLMIAVALITVGRIKSKKAAEDEGKFKKGFVFYSIALVIIIWAGIVKPAMLGNGYF